MRRVPSLVLIVVLGLLALPATALGARSAGTDPETIVVVSGDVTVPRGETVNGIYVASGDVHLAGRSTGDVVLAAGDATVSGRIDGDLITLGGRARLLPRAFVSGDVRYGDERPLVAPTAIVGGDVSKESWSDSGALVSLIGGFVLWLAVGISAAIGIAVAICLPVAAVIAAVTLVGLPLALGIALALLPLGAVAYVASAWALGRRIVKEPRGRIIAFLAGLGILRLAALVPVLGLFVGLAAAVFGLGLIGAAIGAAREPRGPAPAQSPGS